MTAQFAFLISNFIPLKEKKHGQSDHIRLPVSLNLSVHFCAGRNMRIEHQQMQALLVVFVVNGGYEHTAGIDAHHRARRKICYSNTGLSDKLFRLVILVDTGKYDTIGAGTIVESKLEKLLGLLDRLAGFDFYCAEVGLGEGLKVDEI